MDSLPSEVVANIYTICLEDATAKIEHLQQQLHNQCLKTRMFHERCVMLTTRLDTVNTNFRLYKESLVESL